jgi:hypothetical protein
MTMIPQEYTFGCDGLHAVFLQHRADRGGTSPTVTIMIPEAADNLAVALIQARELRARMVIVCDTAKQARKSKRAALDQLPEHREVSLSRVEAGAWGIN